MAFSRLTAPIAPDFTSPLFFTGDYTMPEYKKLDKDQAALLLVDHQSGLISWVQDFLPGDFKSNVIALTDIGKFFNLPTILTTRFENPFN